MIDENIKQEIAEEIDIDGLWYWIMNRYYRQHADNFSVDTLKKIIGCADTMIELEKLLEEENYIL